MKSNNPDTGLPSPDSTPTSRQHILVTGCAGFVGWKTVELLVAAGHQVTGWDNLNTYYNPALKRWRLAELDKLGPEAFTFVELDIEDRMAVDAGMAAGNFSAVINLAARAGVRASIKDPYVYFRTNVDGTVHLLEAMRREGVGKYVLASTSSLYAGQPMPFSEEAPVNEPISPYAASKKGAEAAAFAWHHLYGIDVSILRYFTVYGPAGRPDMAPLRFTHWIANAMPIQLYGDGSQTRDFTYIDDIAAGTVAALRPVGYDVINLGGGNTPISINTMIEQLETHLGKKAIIQHLPFHDADMKATQANNDKARVLLKWEPKTTPEEGFKHTAEWYLKNQDAVRHWV